MYKADTTGGGKIPPPVAPAKTGLERILDKYPRIPITDPEKQVDAVLDFCIAWDGPLHLVYQGRGYLLMPFEYYLSAFCTPEQAEKLRREVEESIQESESSSNGAAGARPF